jgi:pimeloyl-ACP methyl ester carboxylesterase
LTTPGAGFLLIGYDPDPPPGLTIQQVVGSLESAIELVGSRTIDLIGILYGGMIACRLAARRAEQVRQLVLLASGHRFSARGVRHVRQQVELLAKGDVAGFATTFNALFRRRWYNWLISAMVRMTARRVASGMTPPRRSRATCAPC